MPLRVRQKRTSSAWRAAMHRGPGRSPKNGSLGFGMDSQELLAIVLAAEEEEVRQEKA